MFLGYLSHLQTPNPMEPRPKTGPLRRALNRKLERLMQPAGVMRLAWPVKATPLGSVSNLGALVVLVWSVLKSLEICGVMRGFSRFDGV